MAPPNGPPDHVVVTGDVVHLTTTPNVDLVEPKHRLGAVTKHNRMRVGILSLLSKVICYSVSVSSVQLFDILSLFSFYSARPNSTDGDDWDRLAWLHG